MANILTDNFDSYNDGDLNGQGSWSGETVFDVQGTTTYNGTKAIQVGGLVAGTYYIDKSGTERASGKQSFCLMKTSTTAGSVSFCARQAGVADRIYVVMDSTGIRYNAAGAGGLTLITTYSANVWYLITIEWTDEPKQRITVNGVTSTGWVARDAGNPDLIRLGAGGNSGNINYIDEITEDATYNLTASTGTFTLTGIASNFGISMIAGTETFTLTGIDATFTKTTPWAFQSKNSSSWTWQDKSG